MSTGLGTSLITHTKCHCMHNSKLNVTETQFIVYFQGEGVSLGNCFGIGARVEEVGTLRTGKAIH